jgi:hypothetical protein
MLFFRCSKFTFLAVWRSNFVIDVNELCSVLPCFFCACTSQVYVSFIPRLSESFALFVLYSGTYRLSVHLVAGPDSKLMTVRASLSQESYWLRAWRSEFDSRHGQELFTFSIIPGATLSLSRSLSSHLWSWTKLIKIMFHDLGAKRVDLNYCLLLSASSPMGIRGPFPGGKAAGTWSWPLTSI